MPLCLRFSEPKCSAGEVRSQKEVKAFAVLLALALFSVLLTGAALAQTAEGSDPSAIGQEVPENIKKELLNELGRDPLMVGFGISDFVNVDFKKVGDALKLSEAQITELKDKMLHGRMRKDYFLARVKREIGPDGIPRIQYLVMTFRNFKVTENRRPNWDGEELAIEVPLSTGKTVHFLIKCGNAAIFLPPPRPKPPVVKPPIPGAPPEVCAPGVPPEKKLGPRDQWDWYFGSGMYMKGRSNQPTHNGYYYWTKFRYRPLWLDINERTSIGVGAFAFAAGGKGAASDRCGDKYRYDWTELVLGGTGKLFAPNFDVDLDVGYGWLWNKGGINFYKSKQKDKIFLLSAHLNYYWMDLEYRHSFSAKHQHSWCNWSLPPKPWNNDYIDFLVLPHLYKQRINKSMYLLYGFNFNFGREIGVHKNYLKIGPVMTLRAYDEDILQLSFLNYKWRGCGGDQFHPIAGWISIDGIYKAYKARGIKSLENEEWKRQGLVRETSVIAENQKNGRGTVLKTEAPQPTQPDSYQAGKGDSSEPVYKGSVLGNSVRKP